jgi:hypothetical protein
MTGDYLGEHRWTLSEYVLRCETGHDIREVMVEGVIDRDLIATAVKRWGLEVEVREGDFVSVSREEIDAAGFPKGVKGKLLTVAAALDASNEAKSVGSRVVIVVDRDFDPPVGPSEVLMETDGFSVESYALDTAALDEFANKILGRAPRPKGSGGQPQQKNSCSGPDLLGRVTSALVEIASVRMALLEAEPKMKPFSQWIARASIASNGDVSLSGVDLLRDVVIREGRSDELSELVEKQQAHRSVAHSDLKRWVRGHDYISVLSKLLRSPWGRKRNGDFATRGGEHALTRFLLFSIEGHDLDRQPLFAKLKSRFS